MSRFLNRPTARAWTYDRTNGGARYPSARRPAAPISSIGSGARVAYAAHWLRSTQAHAQAHWRGRVEMLLGDGLVLVRWDDQPEPMRVLSCNLVREEHIGLEAC